MNGSSRWTMFVWEQVVNLVIFFNSNFFIISLNPWTAARGGLCLFGSRYIHTHTHTHTCVRVYIHICICIHTHTHTHTHNCSSRCAMFVWGQDVVLDAGARVRASSRTSSWVAHGGVSVCPPPQTPLASLSHTADVIWWKTRTKARTRGHCWLSHSGLYPSCTKKKNMKWNTTNSWATSHAGLYVRNKSVCMYTHTHTHTHMFTPVSMYTCTYMHAHTHAHTCMPALQTNTLRTGTHIHTYIHTMCVV